MEEKKIKEITRKKKFSFLLAIIKMNIFFYKMINFIRITSLKVKHLRKV